MSVGPAVAEQQAEIASATEEQSAQKPSPVLPSHSLYWPIGLDEVRIEGGHWGDRQQANRNATIDHCLTWLERMGWLRNFDLVARGQVADRQGREFSDSEAYKTLEALAWESCQNTDPEIEHKFQAVADRILQAQSEDGYLSTRFGSQGQPERWSDLEWGHELYCAGHLLQAAVARIRTHGEDDFVLAARRVADNLVETFGDKSDDRICGHPEIEVALAEFSRATGDSRYLALAKQFLERRGRGSLGEIEFGQDYFQDDTPVREVDVLRGHAVRANYLAAGAVDLAVETDDELLLQAIERQWQNAVNARTYLTGGQGSHHMDEAFGHDFELPPDRAYSETCAGVGAIMLAWRLFLATGHAKYTEFIERILFNVVSTSPNAEGTAFFYANPLHQRIPGNPVQPDRVSVRADSSERAPWFHVSCCPTNLARTFASLGAYTVAWRGETLALLQYFDGTVSATNRQGQRAELRVITDYPYDGRVEIHALDGCDPVRLELRIPSWAQGATVTAHSSSHVVETGQLVELAEPLKPGDVVTLQLPMAPRWTLPDPRIDAIRGTAAVEVGPLVYCLESRNLGDQHGLDDVTVNPGTSPKLIAKDRVQVQGSTRSPKPSSWPYTATPAEKSCTPITVELRPYHRWGEEGPTAMRVWIPTSTPAASPMNASTNHT